MRWHLSLALIAALLVGCAKDDRPEQARTQVRAWAAKLDAQTDETGIYVRHLGPTEKDPWGNDLIVSYSQGGLAETVAVRSSGPDGVVHSDDDIVAWGSTTNVKGVGTGLQKNIQETAQKGARGAARGIIQGVREELAPKKDKN